MKAYIPYICLTVVHLVACIANKQLLRAISKCLLIPALALGYYLNGGENYFVYIALFFALVGDIILIKPMNMKNRTIGPVFFVISHLVYVYIIVFKDDNKDSLLLYDYKTILCVVLCIGIVYSLYRIFRKDVEEKYRVSSLMYYMLLALILALNMSLAILGLDCYSHLICLLGYVFFTASDLLLVCQWYRVGDPFPKSDFLVMLTYCLGQFFIVSSFLV